MPYIQRAKQLIEVIGIEDYEKLLSMVEDQWPLLLKACHGENFHSNLHQMKSMCYAAGLDELGDKVKNIETMAKNGALATARTHIDSLELLYKNHVKHLQNELANLKKDAHTE